MKKIENILLRMKENPEDVRFKDLCKVCSYYFGPTRQSKSSHKIYRTPWPGDPKINIQNNKGKVKVYQVKQVLLAVDKWEAENDN